MSFWIKLAFIIVEVGLAIAFGVLGDKGNKTDAAIVEWIISLIYIFYVRQNLSENNIKLRR
jgi:hypothetical protein